MSAMRDLANQSARSAVARSVRTQARDTQIKAMKKFCGAGVGIVCALLCMYFVQALGIVWCVITVGMGIAVTLVYAHEGLGLLSAARHRIRMAEAGMIDDESAVEDKTASESRPLSDDDEPSGRMRDMDPTPDA
ncbi:MAG: hypothetical protein HKN47_22780 [Pirellulaceae bacterium]|nr:hypothetical protein [Pirellulaceae bacterium]